MPDLIIVDGGKEQVKAVQQILQELNSDKISIPVIGLVKNEKHQTAKIITPNGEERGFEKAEKIKNFLTNCKRRSIATPLIFTVNYTARVPLDNLVDFNFKPFYHLR